LAKEFEMAAKTTKKAAPAATAATETVGATQQQLFKGYEDFTVLGQENIEAVVQANQVLAKGAEVIGKELMEIAQTSFENAATAAKAYFGAKTLQDVLKLNSEFAKLSLDSFLTNSAKLSDLSVKVANEAFAPIGERVNVTIEKFAKPLAA
jgi:phasin family protein